MFSLYTLDHDGHNFWMKVDDFATAVYEAVHMLAKAEDIYSYNREVVVIIGDRKDFVRVATIHRDGAKALMASYGGMVDY